MKEKYEFKIVFIADIEKVFKELIDADSLRSIWLEYHTHTGRNVKELFPRFVQLKNVAAQRNGFTTHADLLINLYEGRDLEKECNRIFLKVKPLYEKLHNFVREKLYEKYGQEIVSLSGPIPAHLLSSLTSADWSGLTKLGVPFPKKGFLSIEKELKKNILTAKDMYTMGEYFFKALKMPPLPK